jgi:hypothetical protein
MFKTHDDANCKHSGVSLATHIFDNSFSSARSSISHKMQPQASSKPSPDQTDLKRLTYRTLMLKGMSCRPVDVNAFLPFQQSNMAQSSISCEKAREFVANLAAGSEIASADFSSALDRGLQHLALHQVTSAWIVIIRIALVT